MESRDQLREVVEDPSLIPGVVEESLRMFPAFTHFARTATRDTELHGQSIREGEKLVMWYPSSNRDESRFEDAEHFDVRRWSNGGCSPEASVSPLRSEPVPAAGTTASVRRSRVWSCGSSSRRPSPAFPGLRSSIPRHTSNRRSPTR